MHQVVRCVELLVMYMYSYILSGERTGLVVRASDSGSGDPGSILAGSVCC